MRYDALLLPATTEAGAATCAVSAELPRHEGCRLDAPSVVPAEVVAQCKTYREAVRLCWELRRVRNMTRARLAEEAGLYAPHVSCYLNDNERSRDLPGGAVRGFEWACGNTAISQWHGMNAEDALTKPVQSKGRTTWRVVKVGRLLGA